MPLSHYPHGIFATPNIGGTASDYAGWFSTKIYYVDGDNGSDSNAGTELEKPFKTIQKAINSAATQDTIYVRVKAPDADASEPGTYIEDLSIVYAKHGLKIIGVSPQIGVWGGPKIKNASATALLDVLASNVHLENLQFNCTRNSGTYGVYLEGNAGYTTAAGSVATSIINCFLKNSSTTYGGINLIGGYGSQIYGLHTYNAVKAVWLSSSTLPSNDHRIMNCDFTDNNGAAIANHITVAPGLHAGIVIRDCTFGSATAFIICGSGNTGIISGCYFEDTAATLANSTGKVTVPAAQSISVTGCWGGVSLAVIQSAA